MMFLVSKSEISIPWLVLVNMQVDMCLTRSEIQKTGYLATWLNEPQREQTNVLVSDLVRHKPGCIATEDG